jgi:hypothetical protein
MRTVQVDADHVAHYERAAKGVYHFRVHHAATGRHILDGDVRVTPVADVVEFVATVAALRLGEHNAKRARRSQAFAAGRSVPNAPAVPPPIEASRVAGQLNISAALPVKLIRDAYRAVGTLGGESPDSLRSRRNDAALEMGRKTLIGAPDDVILGIARGELTLNGSLRDGVTVVRVTE